MLTPIKRLVSGFPLRSNPETPGHIKRLVSGFPLRSNPETQLPERFGKRVSRNNPPPLFRETLFPKSLHTTCITFILVVLAVLPTFADSLWTQGNGCSLVVDLKARKAGDLITVLVIEETLSTQKASTQYSKDFTHENEAGAGKGLGTFLKLVPALSFGSAQDGSAAGQTTMTNNFITKITATVTNVLPSGNLQIKAERKVDTNKEKQTMTLTATVRPQDVSQDNMVASTNLADLQVTYDGKGPVGDRQKEGFVSRLLRFIF